MRHLFIIATIILQFLSVVTFKLLNSFYLIIAIFISCLVIGILINFSKKEIKKITKAIGWGLFKFYDIFKSCYCFYGLAFV